MSNNACMAAAIMGALLGIFITGIGMTFFDKNNTWDTAKAREVCEKSLPRDQHCILHFIPTPK